MILFLTYHKVRAETDARDFYTVTPERLREHFQALAAAGRQCVSVAAVREPTALPRNNFVLSFDDGTADHFDIVLPLLREHGLTATFFVPTAKLNRPGYLTQDQLRELARAGHSIGCHSHEHRRLDLATDDEMREQIGRSQQTLGDLLGERPRVFAPVGGFMNEHLREVVLGFGVEVIRTMRWGYNQTPDRTALETIPINRHTDDAQFQRILAGRQTNHLYLGKEALKAILPARAYEQTRTLLFRLAGRN